MRIRIFVIALGAFAVALIFTFPLWQPLLQPGGEAAAEVAIPGMSPALQASFETFLPEQQTAYLEVAKTSPEQAVALIQAALRSPINAPEEMAGLPSMVGPVRVVRSQFQRLDPIRWAQGELSVYQQADDSLLARFEDFSTSNAPDLRVLMAAAAAPATLEALGPLDATIDLGQLLGTVGNQNYEIPADVDLANFNSLVLYSPSLNLIMSYAPL
ncbi:MAG: DM13 domain-containing protein [Anaerolineae bacterium]|nr:DM13 domain-containing protein [Anaerolineae bacterium]